MRDLSRYTCKMIGILTCAGGMLAVQPIMAQEPQSAQSLRDAYGALMGSYEQIYHQEGDARGLARVARAKSAMQQVSDAALARIFSRSGVPDLSAAQAAIQRVAGLSSRSLQSKQMLKSLPLPGAPTVIDACINTPHGDQITYDALIAFQVTSGILSAAAWVCNEDILGENGSAACIPFAIANDIASSLFAVRSFCGSLDTAATIEGSYDRLEHIHTDLGNAQTAIINNTNTSTASIISNDNSNKTAIINNDNTNKTMIIANDNTNATNIINNDNANKTAIITVANANTQSIINNDNANRDTLVAEIRALGCEIVRLLNTPDGQRASAILACASLPGYPFSWNKR